MDPERVLIVEKFRAFEEALKHLATMPQIGGSDIFLQQMDIYKQAGALAIRAFDRGWLTKWNGLAEAVGRVKNPPADPPGQCKPVHNEINLFIELCGLHEIPVFNTGHGLEVTGDTSGGILPNAYPDACQGLSFDTIERGGSIPWTHDCYHKAAVCGMLARIVEGAEDPQYHCLVTLDQAAHMVNKSKSTLERLKAKDPTMPLPDQEGGGGKTSFWKWSTIRPWLNRTFNRTLPERFPAERFGQ